MGKGPKTAIKKRIETLLGGYFLKFDTLPQNLNYKIAKPLFLSILSDFLLGLMTPEEFSLICQELYYEVKNPQWYDSFDPELSQTLSMSVNVAWYKYKGEEYYQTLVFGLKRYFEKYRELIEN